MGMDGNGTARDEIVELRDEGPQRTLRVGAVAVTGGVALVCSGVAAFVLFALGLSVHPLIVVPLAVTGTALAAGLCAAWTSTLMSRDGTRADIGAVLRSMVPAALVLLVVVPLVAMLASVAGLTGA